VKIATTVTGNFDTQGLVLPSRCVAHVQPGVTAVTAFVSQPRRMLIKYEPGEQLMRTLLRNAPVLPWTSRQFNVASVWFLREWNVWSAALIWCARYHCDVTKSLSSLRRAVTCHEHSCRPVLGSPQAQVRCRFGACE
jgi:hypothetical protein